MISIDLIVDTIILDCITAFNRCTNLSGRSKSRFSLVDRKDGMSVEAEKAVNTESERNVMAWQEAEQPGLFVTQISKTGVPS